LAFTDADRDVVAFADTNGDVVTFADTNGDVVTFANTDGDVVAFADTNGNVVTFANTNSCRTRVLLVTRGDGRRFDRYCKLFSCHHHASRELGTYGDY
jgi:hypothetical protein